MMEPCNGFEAEGAGGLSAGDGAAVDALLEQRRGAAVKLGGAAGDGGADGAGVRVDAARRARVQEWLNVLGTSAVPGTPGDLVERTLGAVQAERMKIAAGGSRPAAGAGTAGAEKAARKRRSYVAEVGAMLVAAGILVTVLIPAVGEIRQSYRRTLCATNLAGDGTAFGSYAAANGHALPSLGASADGNWLHPGPGGHTNRANLLPLINASYIRPVQLVCAGRGLPEGTAAVPTATDIVDCSYSYVNMFGPQRPTWDGRSATIVLADANPLFSTPGTKNPDANSFNHAGKGTYVLRADGSVTWETSPDVGPGRDNIWTVNEGGQRVTAYVGTETAGSLSDVFLSP